jgi:hypothetical protein
LLGNASGIPLPIFPGHLVLLNQKKLNQKKWVEWRSVNI